MNPPLLAGRRWAITGALFSAVGGVLLLANVGLGLRLFGMFVLAEGARAMWVGVQLQAGRCPSGRALLVTLLLLISGVLATLGVARLMTW